MSLYSNPPHVVTVYPVVQVDDGYGGTMPGEGDPIDVRALVIPRSVPEESTVEQNGREGYLAETVFEVFARSLPAGAWSRIRFNGEDFTAVAEPRRYGVSRRTAHDAVTIRRR